MGVWGDIRSSSNGKGIIDQCPNFGIIPRIKCLVIGGDGLFVGQFLMVAPR